MGFEPYTELMVPFYHIVIYKVFVVHLLVDSYLALLFSVNRLSIVE